SLTGARHRRGDRTHAADHVADEPLLRFTASAEQMKEESEQRAGVVRTAVLAVETVREHQGLEVSRLERAIEKLAEAPGGEGDQVGDLPSAHAPQFQSETQQLAKPGETASLQVGR